MDDLLSVGRKIQYDREHMDNYRAHTSRKQQISLEPSALPRKEVRVAETTISPPENSSFVEQSPLSTTSSRSTTCNSQPTSSSAGFRCWNCDVSGHSFRFCPKLVFPFCTRCGNKDLDNGVCRTCESKMQGNGRQGRK